MAVAVTVSPETHLLSHDGGATYSVPWAAGSAYTVEADYPNPVEPLRVLHVDADVVVVSKPAFLPTENTKLIKDSVRSRVESELIARGESAEGLHVAHRLDWETSGLLVLASHRYAMRLSRASLRSDYLQGAPPTCSAPAAATGRSRCRLPPTPGTRRGQCRPTEGKGGASPPPRVGLCYRPQSGHRHHGRRRHGRGGGADLDADGTGGTGDCAGAAAAQPPPRAELARGWAPGRRAPERDSRRGSVISTASLAGEQRCHQLCQRSPLQRPA